MRTTRQKLKAAHAAGRFNEAKRLTKDEQWRFHQMLSVVALMGVVAFTFVACYMSWVKG